MKETHFPWENFFTITVSLTIIVWLLFFIYDYFLLGKKKTEDIYDNPTKTKDKGKDNRVQIKTDEVTFDSML